MTIRVCIVRGVSIFRSTSRWKFHNRKYTCSNLIFTLFCIYLRCVSRTRLPNRPHVTLFFELVQPRPIEIKFRDFSSSYQETHRYELPMGIESPDRGFQIPIESQVGLLRLTKNGFLFLVFFACSAPILSSVWRRFLTILRNNDQQQF